VVVCVVRSHMKCARRSYALRIVIAAAAVRPQAPVTPQISIALPSGLLGSLEKTLSLDTSFRPHAASQLSSVVGVALHCPTGHAVVVKSSSLPAHYTSSQIRNHKQGSSGVPESIGLATEMTFRALLNSQNGGVNVEGAIGQNRTLAASRQEQELGGMVI